MKVIVKPSEIPERLTLESCKKSLEEVIKYRKGIKKTKVEISLYYYRGDDEDINSVAYKLYNVYKKKCAYCEEERAKLDIEHYRPKGSVGEEISHSGYYWLCYEWSNLILACKDCNRDWKTQHFPITGARIFDTKINPLSREKELWSLEELNAIEYPVLLQPEEGSFLPEKYLKYNLMGRSIGIDCEGRGNGTITICNLNRVDLRRRRKKIMDNIIKQIQIVLMLLKSDLSNKAEVINALDYALTEIVLDDDSIEHTYVHKRLFIDFEKLILSQVENQFHSIIMEAFNLRFRSYL